MTATADRRCFACGKPVNPGDRFCPRCGARLAKARRAAVSEGARGGWTTLPLAFSDDPVPPANAQPSEPSTPLLDGSRLDRAQAVEVEAADASGPDPGKPIASAFEQLAAAVARLPERSRSVVTRRFGLAPGGRLRTLAEVAEALGVTRERVRQIERKALRELAYDRGSFDAAHDRVEDLRQQLGLGWRDESLATALAKLHPQAPWATPGHPRLLVAILPGRTPGDTGIRGVEAAAVTVVARAGALPLAEIERQVLPLLDSADVGRFPALSITRRLELVGPLIRRSDDRYDLPPGAIGVAAEKRVRRLNAMIRVIERLGPSRFTTIAQETNDHLPPENRLSERDVHSWLGRYGDIFAWAGKGRFGLASQNVGIRADAGVPNAGPTDAHRSRRRKGIGDEIVLLLLEQGPLPIETVTEHILSRFRVNPASVAAAVQQDKAKRFTTTGDRLVALRLPDNARGASVASE